MGGCSSAAELTAEELQEARTLVDELAAVAMIDLSTQDRACAAERLTPDELAVLRSDRSDPAPVANVVVDCVGEALIGRSVLRSQSGSLSDASLACAVDELDRSFVVELVSGAMAQEPPRVRAEIEVARALGVCLELDELLDQ